MLEPLGQSYLPYSISHYFAMNQRYSTWPLFRLLLQICRICLLVAYCRTFLVRYNHEQLAQNDQAYDQEQGIDHQ
ncbi:hypothetical protein D3C86_1993000 [compost metagenome]